MFSKDQFKPNLFNQDSDSDDAQPSGFGMNKEFAKNFNKLRSKELMKKHKNDSDSDSDSDASDSSDNDTINPKFDEAFFRAMASLKKKDPKIYDGEVKFFGAFDEGSTSAAASDKNKKALTLVDYERKILLEKGGRYDEDEEDKRPQSPSYNQEQQNLRNEFKKVIEDEDSDDGEWGGIFKRRDKSKEEEAAEDAQYTKWLAGEKANIGENAETLKPLKEYWTDPKLAKDEAFLRDYILSNGYSKDSSKVPCYDDIIGEGDVDPAMSEDEEELEKQAEFEHKYNFRFEEPDSEFIKRYPRTIENSVRRTDDRRKEKREEVKDRKAKEKDQKMRELEMLSKLKKREIEEKIEKLKLVSGNEELAFNDDDLEGEFDPEAYDRKMQTIFDNEYYQVDEGETKPECPEGFEDLQVEDWDNYDLTAAQEDGDGGDEHCEDDDFNMDADFNPEDQKKAFQSELIENTRDRKRRRKRKSKFVEMLQRKKPVFDPNDDQSFGQYIDDYYQLDYEDVIGDTPCRFKYTETVPNDFGLTVEEILLAKNKELNQWASLKKATQIRSEHVERNEIGLYKQRGKNEALKRKILQSLFEAPSDEDEALPQKPEGKSGNKKKIEPVSVNTADNFKVIEEFTDKKEGRASTEESKPFKAVQKKRTISESETKNGTSSELQPSKKSKVDSPKKPSKPKTKASTTDSSKKVASNLPASIEKVTSKPNPSNTQEKPVSVNPAKPSKLVQPKGFDAARFAAAKAAAAKTKHRLAKKPAANKPPINRTSLNTEISDERLRAFGINPKKFQKKQKYGTTTAPGGQKDGAAKQPRITGNVPNNKAKPGAQPTAFQLMKQRLFAKRK